MAGVTHPHHHQPVAKDIDLRFTFPIPSSGLFHRMSALISHFSSLSFANGAMRNPRLAAGASRMAGGRIDRQRFGAVSAAATSVSQRPNRSVVVAVVGSIAIAATRCGNGTIEDPRRNYDRRQSELGEAGGFKVFALNASPAPATGGITPDCSVAQRASFELRRAFFSHCARRVPL
jgi:hypothetical protein